MASPLVVPRGSLQLENGAIYQHFQHGKTVFNVPETEVRLGLLKNVEFQMFTPNYNLIHQQSSARTDAASTNRYGVSDIQEAGFKVQLPSVVKDLTVSVIGGVTIPTVRSLISRSGVQPVIRIPWGKALNDKWSVMGMQSLLVVDSGRGAQRQNHMSMSGGVGKRGSGFGE